MLALALAVSGCSRLPWASKKPQPAPPPPVAATIPAEPPPAPPDTTAADTTGAQRPSAPTTRPARTEKKDNGREDSRDTPPPQVTPPTQVESVMSPEEAKQARERAAGDTLVVVQALRKCAGKQLLPDQESVYEAVRSLMVQIRGALQSGELWRAESLARKARQLAASLNCP
jgi:hypothetical protein